MDWKALIVDLMASGLTQEAIGHRCGVAQNTVSDLYRGVSKSPNVEFADPLRDLHKSVMRTKARAAKRSVATKAHGKRIRAEPAPTASKTPHEVRNDAAVRELERAVTGERRNKPHRER